MSPLPQRKKSAEEIARLRESLGVPGAVTEEAPPAPQAAPPEPVEVTKPPVAEFAPPPAVEPKPVRSLRKAEREAPSRRPESPPDSRLPHQRHSVRELEEIRRREMLSLMNSAPNPRLLPAHPALIIPGYLLPTGMGLALWFYQIPLPATMGAVVAALAIAAFLWLRKPVSRHHAAFIGVLSLFLLVFSALHYFPQLRHAT